MDRRNPDLNLEHRLTTPVSRRDLLKMVTGLFALPVFSSLPGCGYDESGIAEEAVLSDAPGQVDLPNWGISFEGYIWTGSDNILIPLRGEFNSVDGLTLEERGAKCDLKIGIAGDNIFKDHPPFYFKTGTDTTIKSAIIPNSIYPKDHGKNVSNDYRRILEGVNVWLLHTGIRYEGTMRRGGFGVTIKDMYRL